MSRRCENSRAEVFVTVRIFLESLRDIVCGLPIHKLEYVLPGREHFPTNLNARGELDLRSLFHLIRRRWFRRKKRSAPMSRRGNV